MNLKSISTAVALCSLIVARVTSTWTAHSRSRKGRARRKAGGQPNIVLFLTDDQDVLLGSLEHMPRTGRLLRRGGTEIVHGFVTTPICCPSRSSILTGLYVHNHDVMSNNNNCTGERWKAELEKRTFNNYLQRAGYRTGYFGKYLNRYDGSYIPTGWHEWMGLVKNSKFYNYTVNFNGHLIRHGNLSKRRFRKKPFLAVLSFPAPHGPEDPAPQHNMLFESARGHRTASWNHAPNPDKQWLLQRTGKMKPIHVAFTDLLYRRRLQTLQSVDVAIQRVLAELRDMRELQNTYFIYTSDHGYHLGQFGLIKGKNMPYEFDIRVPFLIRGPKVAKNSRIYEPIANIDLLPTILDMGKVDFAKENVKTDGRSFLHLLFSKRKQLKRGIHRQFVGPFTEEHSAQAATEWRHTILIEKGKVPNFEKVRQEHKRKKFREALKKTNKKQKIKEYCDSNPAIWEQCYQSDQNWMCQKSWKDEWKIWKCKDVMRMKETCTCHWRQKNNNRHRRQFDGEVVTIRYNVNLDLTKLDKLSLSMVRLTDRIFREWEDDLFIYLYEDDINSKHLWYQGILNTNSTEQFCGSSPFWNEKSRITSKWCTHRRCRTNVTFRRQRNSVFIPYNEPINVDRLRRRKKRDGASPEENCECHTAGVKRLTTMKRKHPVKVSVEEGGALSNRDLIRLKYEQLMARRGRGGGGRKGRRSRSRCNTALMHCFVHELDHWRTSPLWPRELGEFCFCTNANNNTYSCLRLVNATHNLLYCEFITDFFSLYDLNRDSHQLENQLHNYMSMGKVHLIEQLSNQLDKLRSCRYQEECEHFSSKHWDQPFYPTVTV